MPFRYVLWDLDDDPAGNAWHCAEHGLSQDEVEEVLQSAIDMDVSRATGLPVVFGETQSGRHLMVVFELIDAESVYPVTAYEVPRRIRP